MPFLQLSCKETVQSDAVAAFNLRQRVLLTLRLSLVTVLVAANQRQLVRGRQMFCKSDTEPVQSEGGGQQVVQVRLTVPVCTGWISTAK
jgi:hypothetical protein